jgi:hypothetical protein
MPNIPQRLYQSPPGSGQNDGTLPQVYDVTWQTYTNLTPAQIAAFKSFPQFLNFYAGLRRWLAEISGTAVTYNSVLIPLATDDRSKLLVAAMRQAVDDGLIATAAFVDVSGNSHTLDVNGVKAVHQAIMGFVQALFAAHVSVIVGINATPQTITNPLQIDAVFAPLAPNSPSALNPGLG